MVSPEHKNPEPVPYVCPAEHAGWLSMPLRKLVNNPRRILRGLVNEGDTVVDVGCGPGFFSLPLARMVGEDGRVIAVDVQEEMLSKLRARAETAGLASRVQFHHSATDNVGVVGPVDFVLAFWMLHEVPDRQRFLVEVHGMLAKGGRLLLVEPVGHVSRAQFRQVVELAKHVGLGLASAPRIGLSRAALFVRD